MFQWKPKVVVMWLLIQQQQIVIVGNRLARKNNNCCRLRFGTLAQHQWIVYWFNIVYISTQAVSYSIICVLGCLFG